MRGNTRATVGVGSDAVVEAMVNKQLGVRDCLPKAANGAHRAPSNPRAAQILKDMRQGGSKEFSRLYCVAVTNLEDGVPLDQVEAPLHLLLVAIRTHAARVARTRAERPVLSCVSRFTKAEHRIEHDEHRLLADLNKVDSAASLAIVDEAIRDCEAMEAPLHELTDTLRAQRVAMASAPAPRRHLILHGSPVRHTLPMGVTR